MPLVLKMLLAARLELVVPCGMSWNSQSVARIPVSLAPRIPPDTIDHCPKGAIALRCHRLGAVVGEAVRTKATTILYCHRDQHRPKLVKSRVSPAVEIMNWIDRSRRLLAEQPRLLLHPIRLVERKLTCFFLPILRGVTVTQRSQRATLNRLRALS